MELWMGEKKILAGNEVRSWRCLRRSGDAKAAPGLRTPVRRNLAKKDFQFRLSSFLDTGNMHCGHDHFEREKGQHRRLRLAAP
jgi:hypothetical protein